MIASDEAACCLFSLISAADTVQLTGSSVSQQDAAFTRDSKHILNGWFTTQCINTLDQFPIIKCFLVLLGIYSIVPDHAAAATF